MRYDLFVNQKNVRAGDVNPLTTYIPHHTETSQLIYNANQLTGFYMMKNIGR